MTVRLEIDLVFDDWRKHGQSVYSTDEGIELSMGDFHSGTTLKGVIELPNEEVADELQSALERGYCPVFSVFRRSGDQT